MPTSTPVLGGTKMTKADNRAAVEKVLRLVAGGQSPFSAPTGTPDPSGAATAPGSVALLPTAAARTAIDYLAGCGTAAYLDEQRPNLKQLLSDPMNWAGHVKATKAVTKAIGASITGTDEHGHSTYPQAVEMVSYLALCAPMLEPDRLARIAALAATTPNAYRPLRYVVGPATQLRKILSNYQKMNGNQRDKNADQRIEDLLSSLWVAAHDGRWWNATAGNTDARRTRRRGPAPTLNDEEKAAVTAQVQMLLEGGRTKPTVKVVCDAFENKLLTFSHDAADMLARVEVTTDSERNRLRNCLKYPDADVGVLLSYIPGLLPDDRAESPIPALISSLLEALGQDEDWADTLPEKPKDWAELYPAASRAPFPLPDRVKALHGRRVPGLPGGDIELMLNPDLLKRNADHMGNCTFSYKSRSEQGSVVIGRVSYAGTEFNFALNCAGPTWTLGEVNSRFNRAGVPAEVRNALTALVTNPPV